MNTVPYAHIHGERQVQGALHGLASKGRQGDLSYNLAELSNSCQLHLRGSECSAGLAETSANAA